MKIPWMSFLVAGATIAAGLEGAQRFGQWRKDTIAAGDKDPLPEFVKDIPGGTATVFGVGGLLASSYALKGKNRAMGQLASAAALSPGIRKLFDDATATTDHAAPDRINPPVDQARAQFDAAHARFLELVA